MMFWESLAVRVKAQVNDNEIQGETVDIYLIFYIYMFGQPKIWFKFHSNSCRLGLLGK